MKRLAAALCATLICSACQGSILRSATPEYPLPAVPDSLRLPEERATYVLSHFWDAYAPECPCAADPACMEQAMANFASISKLGYGENEVTSAINCLVNVASQDKKAVNTLSSVVDKCLNEEESPVYDTKMYLTFVKAFAKSESAPEWIKAKYGALERLMSLNAVGTKAGDIAISLRDGDKTNLHNELGPNYTILILYSPDCEHCKTIIGKFAAEPLVGKWIESGFARVVAVDILPSENSDETTERMPENWIVGTDATGVEDKDIYYVPSTPTFYLLDGDGIVLLKDADATDVLEAVWRQTKLH